MAKFLKRMLKRHFKGKDHVYVRYVLEIPARFNAKMSLYLDLDFDEIDMAASQSSTEEVLNIILVKKKR